MIETMLLLVTVRDAFRRNRWYIIGGLGLFGLVEALNQLFGWA